MEIPVLQRIATIIKEKNISITLLSKRIGIVQTTLNRQLKGEVSISYSTVEAIVHYFSDVSAEWLMRGKGEMILTDSTNTEDLEKEIFRLQTENKLLREMIGLKNEESKEKTKSVS